MCGILGFLTDKPSEENYQLLLDLMDLSATRGTDATGLAVHDKEAKEFKIFKEPIPADKFIKKYFEKIKPMISKSRMVVGHTRLATQGHPRDNHNNHPIVSDSYIMVHNGVCSTMDRIKGYKYKGEVDSEILLSYVEKEGLSKGLKALRGSAAVAIVPTDSINTVYLWRHSNPLWLAYDPDKKTLFFGSTEDILREGLANLLSVFSSFQMRQIAEDFLYKVTHTPLNIEIMEKIEPKGWKDYSYKGKSASSCSGYRGMEGDDWGECYGVDCNSRSDDLGTTKGTSPIVVNADADDEETDKVATQLVGLKWDGENKAYVKDLIPKQNPKTRYYFDGHSLDFTNWTKLTMGGHISIDRQLVKFYDKEKHCHFLMTLYDAIGEGVLDMST